MTRDGTWWGVDDIVGRAIRVGGIVGFLRGFPSIQSCSGWSLWVHVDLGFMESVNINARRVITRADCLLHA
jgi:hypothetical protein